MKISPVRNRAPGRGTPAGAAELPETAAPQQAYRFKKLASASIIHSATAIAASAAEDEKQDDPQAAVIAASASVAHSAAAVAASAAEDEKQDDPQTGIVSAASEETAATGIFTSASTVCCA